MATEFKKCQNPVYVETMLIFFGKIVNIEIDNLTKSDVVLIIPIPAKDGLIREDFKEI